MIVAPNFKKLIQTKLVMCKCHFLNHDTGMQERVKGLFSLNTGNIGDVFIFPHETFKRQIIDINFIYCETFAPPIDNYSGLDERGLHTFHNSFKAIFE